MANIVFLVFMNIFNVGNQETNIKLKYRYINSLDDISCIIEYTINRNDACTEYSSRASSVKIKSYIHDDERHLLFDNENIKSIYRSFKSSKSNGQLRGEGSVQIEFEKSIAKYRLVNNGEVKEGTIILPDNWIPRMLHFDPSILYFVSKLKPEMVGYEGVLIQPVLGSYMKVETARYRIDKVEKKIHKINNNEYECDVYTIIIQREKYEGTIMRKNYWKELIYVYNNKLIEYNYEGIIKLIIEE